ncbi:NACHT domain-containing protein [Microscilla marina]|uniref:NACHT domain-containing protein n=1 Tax=Microscilla marina ATCC 23134 TaxID=313606 RepID=A1ZMI1_MICM2|nr:NACHT domain-containing protein [Microscilla marina]EAY28361.1 hypothetical protein M23134_03913 [Microscilla marina ATCC 23134]
MKTVSSQSYLHTPPASVIAPPVKTAIDELPIEQLSWEDFEKLCLRIVQIEYSLDDCEIFGTKGQRQEGIDIYALKDNSRYATYQSKRYQQIKDSDLDKIVDKFKKGKLYSKSDEFVLCTTASMNTTQLQDKFNALKSDLNKSNIQFIKWDKVQLCRILKDHPQIVYDFFGEAWVTQFNGAIHLEHIITTGKKLDAAQVAKFRKELYKLYKTVFQQHDPGLPAQQIKKLDALLEERFIIPDVNIEKTRTSFVVGSNKTERNYSLIQQSGRIERYEVDNESSLHQKDVGGLTYQNITTRTSIDAVLPNYQKSIILGDPGSGKSTLLRFLVLDILSNTPQLLEIAQQWGRMLPVWLPFAYITKHITSSENLSLPTLVKMWLKSLGKESLFNIVNRALEDNRLLLVIDGVDEWSNTSAASQSIAKIEIQASLTNAHVLYSSRPYGYKLLKDSFRSVKEILLAPFSEQQQYAFSLYWYTKWTESLGEKDVSLANKNAEQFIKELKKSSDFKALAENPLLLSILITQKFKDAVLPRNKYKALANITEYLISTHPVKRKEPADIIIHNKWDFELNDIFLELAIHIQKNSFEGVILKEDAQRVIREFLVGYMNYEVPKAKKISKELIDIGANEIGIIIEKSTEEIAFMHRQFQEFLAAKSLRESETEEAMQVLKEFAHKPAWHQVLNSFFGLIPYKKGCEFNRFWDCVKAPENTNVATSLYAKFVRYELALNLNNAPAKLAMDNFTQIKQEFEYETNESIKGILWNIILETVHHHKIKDEVLTYLFNYFPNYYRYDDYRISDLRGFSLEELTIRQKDFLLKSLINGNEYQKLAASYTIQKFIKDEWLYAQITNLLDTCFNPEILAYALHTIITDGVEENIQKLYVQKFASSRHPIVYLFWMKLKVFLKIQSPEELLNLVDKYSGSDTLDNIFLFVLMDGWGNDKELLEICLTSVDASVDYTDKVLGKEAAWKILFHCYNNSPKVVDRIVTELQKEDVRKTFYGHETNWAPQLMHYFQGNVKLIPSIDAYLDEKKDYYVFPKIYLCLISKNVKAKKFLMKNIEEHGHSDWYVNALLMGWKDDEEVMHFLKNYFLTLNSSNADAAGFISQVYSDAPKEGINILETIIFDRNISKRAKAVKPFIELDKEYFQEYILDRFVLEELTLLPKDLFAIQDYNDVIHILTKNFTKNKNVKEFIFSKLTNEAYRQSLLIEFFDHQLPDSDKRFSDSLPLKANLRLQLIEKISESTPVEKKVLEQLSLYAKEGDYNLRTTIAINYFKALKYLDEGKVLTICKDSIFHRGSLNSEGQRRIAFCGYLISQKLDIYFQLQEKGTNFKTTPKLFGGLDIDNQSLIITSLLIENFDYVMNVINNDITKLLDDNPLDNDVEDFWKQLAINSGKLSPSYPYIIDYINDNQETITDIEIIDFLNRTAPKSKVLRKIALRLIDSHHRDKRVYAANVLGKNFINDPIVKEKMHQVDLGYKLNKGKLVALCIGWPEADILKETYEKIKPKQRHNDDDVEFHIKFLFSQADRVVGFFDRVLENYSEAKYHYKYFAEPMKRRIQEDTQLQQVIKKKLLKTTSASAKVSYLALLNYANYHDEEINNWKEEQMKSQENQAAYGYNIVTNELIPFSDLLYDISF